VHLSAIRPRRQQRRKHIAFALWLACLALACRKDGQAQLDASAAMSPDAEVTMATDAGAPMPPSAAVRTIGRLVQADGEWRAAWSGSGVAVRFRGTGLALEIRDEGKNYFQVTVDGKEMPVLRTTHHEMAAYEIAKDLAAGEHEAIVAKRTDPSLGEIAFGRALPAGELLPPSSPLPRRIEFIGDSITAGNGVMGHGPVCWMNPDIQNYFATYGPLTAQRVGAEHRGLSWGGKTIAEMTDMFGRTLPKRPESTWDFTKEVPDVVVLNLGTNDFALFDPGAFQFVAKYTKLVGAVRAAYPDALVIGILGPMLSDAYPEGKLNLTKARGYMKTTFAKLEARGEKRAFFLEVEEQKAADGFGCGYHPSPKTHARIADALATLIKSKMAW
jgi:lysophospholipase L1-like esterase